MCGKRGHLTVTICHPKNRTRLGTLFLDGLLSSDCLGFKTLGRASRRGQFNRIGILSRNRKWLTLRHMNKTPSPASKAIIVPEIEQFGGAERSVLALSHWLYRQRMENHFVTYVDHLGLAPYASHPITIVQLKPEPGPRAKVRALRRYFKELPPDSPKPLGSGYQAALHSTLAGMRGFHTLMHDTACLFGDEDVRSTMGKVRIAVSNRIIGYGLRSGGRT